MDTPHDTPERDCKHTHLRASQQAMTEVAVGAQRALDAVCADCGTAVRLDGLKQIRETYASEDGVECVEIPFTVDL